MTIKGYEIIKKIGAGGFGQVYLATRQLDGVQVAIKCLHDGAGKEELHRLEREVKLIQAQTHPNIVRLLAADLTAVPPYFVMPYMSGGTLTRFAGRLTDDQLRTVLRSVASVLSHLHQNGSIHRDVKPDNLLVDGNGQVVVGDFGLGNNPLYTVMYTANAAGTHGYMAPELLAGSDASAASDIYSLGATLFHLVTGVRPSATTNYDPSTHNPNVPDDLRNIVLRLMQRDPAKRPTATRLCVELNTIEPAPQQSAPSGGYTPRRDPTTVGGGRYG